MAHSALSQTRLDRWFGIVVVFKGIDGVLELFGGAVLLLVPNSLLQRAVFQLDITNFVSSHTILAHAGLALANALTTGLVLYTAIYLLLHGIIKIGLVFALLGRYYKLYPAAIVVLILFMIYQIYRIFAEHDVIFDGTLTVIDAVVVWLTVLEYQRHQRHHELPSS